MAKSKTSFKKGQSGNPAGRRAEHPEFREALAARQPKALELLDEMLKGEDADDRRFAVKTVIEYSVAKPAPDPGSGGGNRLDELVRILRGES